MYARRTSGGQFMGGFPGKFWAHVTHVLRPSIIGMIGRALQGHTVKENGMVFL
jgi:hypothetical protein